MFWFIKKRKEKKKKEKYRIEKKNKAIKQDYKSLEAFLDKKQSEWRNSYISTKTRRDSVCDKCWSNNFVNKFRDVNWEIDWYVSWWWNMFSFSVHWNTHWEVRTDKVLCCQDCWNEQKPREEDYKRRNDIFIDYLHSFYFCHDNYPSSVDFDPNNPEDEAYSSYKDKLLKTQKEHESRYKRDTPLVRFYPETIKRYLKNNYFEYDFYKDCIHRDNEEFYEWWFKKYEDV